MQEPPVTLGTFAFVDFEIPERIALPRRQKFVKHELIGGNQVLQALGIGYEPISWDGIHKGPDARDRSEFLDLLCGNGVPVSFAFYDYAFTVLVTRYVPSFETPFRIGFQIELEVVSDTAPGIDTAAATDTDAQMHADAQALANQAAKLQSPWEQVQAQIKAVTEAIDKVSSYRTAVLSQINTLITPLRTAQITVQAAIVNATSIISLPKALGGIVPSLSVAQQGISIRSQAAGARDLASLVSMHNLLGRMTKNVLSADPASDSKSIVAPPGPLAKVAQQQYGDATQWPSIARASGLTDPQLKALTNITVPRAP